MRVSTTDPLRDRYGQRRNLEERDEDVQTPEQIYAGALEAAASDQIRIRRYIRLFGREEFRTRGQGLRREYLTWMGVQLHQLKRNAHYILIDVVPAPKWGSNVARIVTHRRLLEVVGNGEACLLLVGENVSEAIRRQSREGVLGGSGNRNSPKHYGQTRPWRDLPGDWLSVETFEKTVWQRLRKVFEESKEEGDH